MADSVVNIPIHNSDAAPAEADALSKNARKKELKNKQKEEERRRKEEEKEKKAAAMPKSATQKQSAADDEDMDPTQYFDNRLKTLAAQKTSGLNPYPHKFHVSMSILEYIEKYETLNSGDHLEDVQVSLAGRLMNKRSSSSKLFFYDLHGSGGKVQVMADASNSKGATTLRSEGYRISHRKGGQTVYIKRMKRRYRRRPGFCFYSDDLLRAYWRPPPPLQIASIMLATNLGFLLRGYSIYSPETLRSFVFTYKMNGIIVHHGFLFIVH